MRKTQLLKEAFIASLMVILIDILISFFPLKLELIKPIKQGFDDFDVYDLRYSGNDQVVDKKDTNITILQIGDNRSEIAEEINKVTALHPKLIALDAIFYNPGNPGEDSLLITTIRKSKHLVLASEYSYDANTEKEAIKNSFLSDSVKEISKGYFNFVEGPEDIKRHFAPFLSVGNIKYPSFTAAMAKEVSMDAYQRLLSRDNPIETINYAGNLSHYNVVSLDRFLSGNDQTIDDYFRDKIVLIGFIKYQQTDVLEDIHFTPMNHKHGGKSFPDTYGVVIHANILEMLLSGNYINEMPTWLVYLSTFFLLMLINVFYIRIVSKSHKHNHFGLFLFQFVFALFLIYVALLIFNSFNYRIDIMPSIIAVVLSFEIFWLYEWFALKMKNKFGYKTFVHG